VGDGEGEEEEEKMVMESVVVYWLGIVCSATTTP